MESCISCICWNLLRRVFLLCTVIAWACTSIALVGTVTAADFCYESPDRVVQVSLLLLNRTGSKDSSLSNTRTQAWLNEATLTNFSSELLLSVVSNCISVPGNASFSYAPDLLLITSLHQRLETLSTLLENQNSTTICPHSLLASLWNASQSLGRALCTLAGRLHDAHRNLRCPYLHQIYSEIVYDRFCEDGQSALCIIVICQLFLLVVAMILLYTGSDLLYRTRASTRVLYPAAPLLGPEED